MEYLILLLLLFLLIIVSLTLYSIRTNSGKNEAESSLIEIDKSIELQQTSINEISRDLQSFQDPLKKLNRYLSGGTLAGKFGEWSLDAIVKDIFNSSQFETNYEVIPGSGKRVEFVIKLPEGLLLPIDAKFPSALFDNYIESAESGEERLQKKAKDDIKRHVIKDADDIKTKYVQDGITIDLGIMYIPSEALMQVIDSIDKLREELFRDKRILIMGPNSLAAYLISIHMGFRTLALNERAGDVMNEFGKLSVDGQLINHPKVPMSEITEGCICCAMKSDVGCSGCGTHSDP